MKAETRQTLELLVEKVNHLKSFKFDEHVKTSGRGFRITLTEEGWVWEFNLPDDEKRDSFILTFRFFYQENESISLAKLGRFFNDPELSNEWKQGVSTAREKLNKYLQGYPSSAGLFGGKGRRPTRRNLLDTVLFGDLAHATPDWVAQYKSMTPTDVHEFVLQQTIAEIFVDLLGILTQIGELTERELALNS